MPKSKEFIENSDSEESKSSNKTNSASDEETPKVTVSKKSKAKNTNGSTDDPPAKRVKPNEDTVPSTVGLNGERLYEIGKSRFVSVSQFRGKPYINIREYYDDNGVQKPGKKGISLPGDQWEKLKELFSQIDKDLKNSK
ncbi:hypothetical protein I4U23_002541 [Adineta vaga]|nr:hypothetical protein I4U23_002541 [Adineta vaga]